jgi:hypothetical protein
MQVFVKKEESFFEMTQHVMNKRDTADIDLQTIKNNWKKAIEPMIACISNSKVVQHFLFTCRIELIAFWVIKRL